MIIITYNNTIIASRNLIKNSWPGNVFPQYAFCQRLYNRIRRRPAPWIRDGNYKCSRVLISDVSNYSLYHINLTCRTIQYQISFHNSVYYYHISMTYMYANNAKNRDYIIKPNRKSTIFIFLFHLTPIFFFRFPSNFSWK